eukprot:1156753-Pelagomonas_calceolata.AAC.11
MHLPTCIAQQQLLLPDLLCVCMDTPVGVIGCTHIVVSMDAFTHRCEHEQDLAHEMLSLNAVPNTIWAALLCTVEGSQTS